MSERYDCSDPEQRAAGLKAAVEAVRRGELIVLPTDTVYGIGADAFAAHLGEEPGAESHEQNHASRVTAPLVRVRLYGRNATQSRRRFTSFVDMRFARFDACCALASSSTINTFVYKM